MPRLPGDTNFKDADKSELIAKFCEEIAFSTESLQSIRDRLSEGSERFPVLRTIFKWISSNDDYKKSLDNARAWQAELYVDRIREIIDKVPQTLVEVNYLRLTFDACRWMAGKQAPFKYGDNTDLKVAQLEQKLESLLEKLNGKSRSD